MTRQDETWFRLRQWTQAQAPSERLAAHVLHAEGYEGIDPSHPLGGKDGAKDAVSTKDGKSWVMGVYFPREQQTFGTIKKKFSDDLAGARKHSPHGFVFVTNQELLLAQRATLEALGGSVEVELYHLERTMGVIDRPGMAQIRTQYLDIEAGPLPIDVELSIDGPARYFSDGDDARSKFISAVSERERKRFDEAAEAERSRSPFGIPPIRLSNMLGIDEGDPEPQTRAELDKRLAAWAEDVREDWVDSEQYLAAIAWPSVRLRLRNIQRAFLNDVQVIVTIKGAQVFDWEEPDAFELNEFLTPFAPPRKSPFESYMPSPVIDYSRGLQLAGAPLSWENTNDETVTITIELQHFRPDQIWTSEDNTLILHAVDPTASSLTAQWTVTAQTYGETYSGAPIDIPVQAESVGEAFQAAANTARAKGN